MPPLYITTQGAKLRYGARRLVVEKDGKEIAALPAVHVDRVLIFGNVGLTTPAMSFLLETGIDTVFMTLRGRFKGRLVGPDAGNGHLRLRQYERVSDEGWALETARAIVKVKLHNTRTLLRRYARRMSQKEPAAQDATALTAAADRLGELIDRADRCRTVNSLNGVEGTGAAVYFSCFRGLIQGDEWEFSGRNRRPPRDPVNAMLSFGYTVLANNVEAAVRAAGLDPYLGFLHQVAYNRPSLALDLMEEFRVIVVDSVVLRCLNANQIRPEHFQMIPDGTNPVLLTDEGRTTFIRALEARLRLEFKHPVSKEQVTYRRCFELQARQLARCLQSGKIYEPFRVH